MNDRLKLYIRDFSAYFQKLFLFCNRTTLCYLVMFDNVSTDEFGVSIKEGTL